MELSFTDPIQDGQFVVLHALLTNLQKNNCLLGQTIGKETTAIFRTKLTCTFCVYICILIVMQFF